MKGSQRKRVKVPTILQMEATECGAASLAMVLAYYKLWLPLPEVRQQCGVNRDGSKAGKIVMAAKRLGCESKGYRSTFKRLLSKEFPLIIHWEFNHFVVLEGFDEQYAYINDPANGRRKVPFNKFKGSFTGIVLEIRPGKSFQPAGRPYSACKEFAKKLLEDKTAVVYIGTVSLGLVFAGIAVPVFYNLFIDEILTLRHLDWMFELSLAMTAAIFLIFLMNTMRAVILTRWQRKLTIADSSRFFWHAIRLPMSFFSQRYSAEVASRVAYSEEVASVMSESVATSVLDLIVAIFFLMLLFNISISLTLIGLVFTGLNICVFWFLREKIADQNMLIQQHSAKEYGTLINGLSSIESIKASSSEGDFFAKWSGYHTKMVSTMQKVQLLSSAYMLLPVLFAGLNSALIVTVGGFSIISGSLTAGMFVAFQNLMGNFQTPIDKLVGLGNILQNMEIKMRRLDDVMKNDVDKLSYPDEAASVRHSFAGSRLSGRVDINGVDFGYSPLEEPLIENFELHVQPGQWVALAGASGSGKSTLAKLVSGLYKEWKGEILFDGVPRADIPREVIVESLATVDQNIFQISGTVAESITLFDKSISSDDVIQAAKDACIHDDIIKLENGYDGIVMENGNNFSGGQCQRLEIARALARRPSILVLDEATSALDPVTEKKVMQNLRRYGCTCIIVAHRLSTIRDCDEIIFMEHGKVAERGTHDELMRNHGPYSRLYEQV